MAAHSPTPRDRVYTALACREPDICSYYIWIHPEMLGPLSAHYGVADVKEDVIVDHSVMCEVLPLQESLGDGRYRDEFGTVWQEGKYAQHVSRPALASPSLKGYRFPNLTTDAHFQHLLAWFARYPERFRIVQLGLLFFERAWRLRGMENILVDLHESPAFVDELFDRLEEVCSSVIDHLLQDYGAEIDAIGFSDDYGAQGALLISPDTWRRFMQPHLRRMYARIHAGGKKVYLHSCGHVTPIIPDFIAIGVDMLQPLQPESMDIFDIKRRFGRDLCLVGGISTQRTLPYGPPQDVMRKVQDCLRFMAKGGGNILAPAKPILPGVPLEKATALIDTITRQEQCQ